MTRPLTMTHKYKITACTSTHALAFSHQEEHGCKDPGIPAGSHFWEVVFKANSGELETDTVELLATFQLL